MENKPFQIYRLGVLLETPGVVTTFEREQDFAWQLILFLRNNNLLAGNPLPKKKEDVKMDFRLMSTHVTEEGLEVLRQGLDKWLDKNDDINRTMVDMTPLEKTLMKIKKQK